jgi:putative ABC transport system permease protein
LKPGEEENFAVNKMSMITDAISSLFKQIRLIGIIIGGFAMVVGCFGVANIMFVSVKERTREIGIQKALGAKNWFISSQFLLESVWLSIAGGGIGLLIVAGVMALLDVIAKQSMGSDIQLSLMFDDAMLGVVTSVVVGLVAGFLPARSAANLNPVEAMRSN